MKSKILSFILSGLFVMAIPRSLDSYAVETSEGITPTDSISETVYSAGLISLCSLSCSSGNKAIYISADVRGTDTMSKIGFKNIKIQRSSNCSDWVTEKTVSDLLDEHTSGKAIASYSVSVNGGYYYRVVLDHYAKENTWWFPDTQTINQTSNYVWVP